MVLINTHIPGKYVSRYVFFSTRKGLGRVYVGYRRRRWSSIMFMGESRPKIGQGRRFKSHRAHTRVRSDFVLAKK